MQIDDLILSNGAGASAGAGAGATAQRIFTRVSHNIRTATVRQDMVGWVVSGRKCLATEFREVRFSAGQVFLIPRSTVWDVINEAVPGGSYEARLISFGPRLIEEFHERFGQFSAAPSVNALASTTADDEFVTTFEHALKGLLDLEMTRAVQEHRAMEVLLMLAQRGLIFSASRKLTWADRVHRLVSQRPHARWTVDDIARACHTSPSTLQRRLTEEETSVSRCVREARLETGLALLQSSELQISEIAAHCGYDSHSRFSAAFRQRFGYPPSHLRT